MERTRSTYTGYSQGETTRTMGVQTGERDETGVYDIRGGESANDRPGTPTRVSPRREEDSEVDNGITFGTFRYYGERERYADLRWDGPGQQELRNERQRRRRLGRIRGSTTTGETERPQGNKRSREEREINERDDQRRQLEEPAVDTGRREADYILGRDETLGAQSDVVLGASREWEVARCTCGSRTRGILGNGQDKVVAGIRQHKHVIIDDIRKDFCTCKQMLRLIDRYPYQIEYKGGSRQFLARKIWITCPFDPETYWNSGEEDRHDWKS